MSNYNIQLQSNNTDLQEVLELLQTKAAGEDLSTEIAAQETLISEQDAKIAELAEILAGKASGGSSSFYESCFVNIINNTQYAIQCITFTTVNQNGELNYYFNKTSNTASGISCEIAKGFPISIYFDTEFNHDTNDLNMNTNITVLYNLGRYICFVINGGDSHTVTIDEGFTDGGAEK